VLLVRRGAILSNAVWLVRLVQSLKVEQIDAPVEHAANATLPVGHGVIRAGDGGAVAGASVGGPAGFAVPEFGGGGRAGDGLDVVECLHNIVEIGGGRIANFLGLPVGERIDEAAEMVSLVVTGIAT
jgi:hypothetical protein